VETLNVEELADTMKNTHWRLPSWHYEEEEDERNHQKGRMRAVKNVLRALHIRIAASAKRATKYRGNEIE
jgi:hypothetical protein